jgi:hypothetical protein
MAIEIFAPILPLQLDSRNVNDIVKSIQTRIFIESGGKLNDFTPASPLAAISEGQGFAQAELLYYLNTLPEAVTVQWLRSLGIQRKLGSRALVNVTFRRLTGYNRPVTIPKGTRVFARGGQVFILLEQAIVTESSATVLAQSERWGSVYNVPANDIIRADRNYLGLESLTNLEPAEGGTDLETVEQMKIRAFQLFGRRNLVSREDFRSEVRVLAPEATIVEVLPYEERFEGDVDNNRGLFIVAGKSDGSPISTGTQSLVLTSLRDRTSADVKIYLSSPTIVPVEVVVSILWNPRNVDILTDTLAAQINQVLREFFNPEFLGLGVVVSHTDIFRRLLDLDFVIDCPILDIKEMILDPEVTSGTDRLCGRFLGIESEDGEECLYSYNQIIDKSSNTLLTSKDSTSTFRLYNSEISFTSAVDFSTLTYTYEAQYDIF